MTQFGVWWHFRQSTKKELSAKINNKYLLIIKDNEQIYFK